MTANPKPECVNCDNPMRARVLCGLPLCPACTEAGRKRLAVQRPSPPGAREHEVNVIVETPHSRPGDAALFFGDEPVIRVPAETGFWRLLVDLGFFSGTGQAKGAGWPRDIPEGFTDQVIGKARRRLTILKARAIQIASDIDPDRCRNSLP